MKRFISFIPMMATVILVIVALILMNAFGRKIAFGFMLTAILITVAASAVIGELRKHRDKKMLAYIQKSGTMPDFLKRRPDELRKMQSWDEEQLAVLLEALDADDARAVRELLGKGSGPE